jgi:hypothetical protein
MQCRKESRYSINLVGYAEHACWRLMSDYWIHRGSLKKGARDRSRYALACSAVNHQVGILGKRARSPPVLIQG